MIKKFFALSIIFFLAPMTSHAEITLDTLWDSVKIEQVEGMPQGLAGAWPEEITLNGNPKALFSDMSPFSALQIMLRLESMHSKGDLAGYSDVKNKFKPFVNYYLDHRLEGEPYGAIGFWPVWKLDTGELIRAPSTDPRVRQITGDDLPADSDDSSQMAIWLHKTEPGHPYIAAYLKMLANILDENRTKIQDREAAWKKINSGAFMTWVTDQKENNDVDCVVNINVLTSLSLIKKSTALSSELLQAEKKSSALIFDAMTQSKFPACSYYYSRWSHFYFALGKLYEAGGGVFTAEQWQTIRTSFKATLLQRWAAKDNQSVNEWAEFLLTSQMLGMTKDPELSPVLAQIKRYLLQKIQSDSYYTLTEGNDVFYGKPLPGISLFWYVKAQTATLLMEAVADERKTH